MKDRMQFSFKKDEAFILDPDQNDLIITDSKGFFPRVDYCFKAYDLGHNLNNLKTKSKKI